MKNFDFFTMALCEDADGDRFNVIIPDGVMVNKGDYICINAPECGGADMLDVISTVYTSASGDAFDYARNFAPVIGADSVTEIFNRCYEQKEEAEHAECAD